MATDGRERLIGAARIDIQETRRCNLLNLDQLARYYEVDAAVFRAYYDELLDDSRFLAGINERLTDVRDRYGFKKGIFQRERIDSVDWFAFQRVLLYVLVRHLRPLRSLETGVYYGGNTAFILNALARNGRGRLVSVDLPDSKIRSSVSPSRHPFVGDTENYTEALAPGFLIPRHLTNGWEFIEGDSQQVIPSIEAPISFAILDSDHSMGFLSREIMLTVERSSPMATIIVDDIDWSNAFFDFCVRERHYPLLMTDNGKAGLLVRTGLVRLDHEYSRIPEVTGRDAR